ncbi:sulfide:quinone oxidoreductase [Lishizhenia tianjinensis]|uniref:Sulfide:quinone oxidoreductase n=1 Tax=Lishizhenia tianjinensis TaxID=477690 RepID=A0A1I6XU56_9FLAO|nr:FAD/NAD(P)-binding oxidoreductase [Lishizhenia tianjinensis]SFT41870.1 sulfide:quinone oxidoreductase [Lishizhenia tianjinensis]
MHYEIIIIGGGTGGLMLAAQMQRQGVSQQIALVDPSEHHYYQPAFTLVGAGDYSLAKTKRSMASLIPKGVKWIQDSAIEIKGAENTVKTAKSGSFTYDFLVLSPGLVYDLSLVEGLEDALGKGVVCSNYTNPEHTWEVLQNFKGGTALFTQPTTPIKCGGAPQKATYLADAYFKKKGIKDQTNVVLAMPGSTIFGIPEIKKTLQAVVDRKELNVKFGHELVKIDGEKRIAWYRMNKHEGEVHPKDLKMEKDGDLTGIHYDMLHTAPPSVTPAFLRYSELVNEGGWLDVDIHTLQHKKYPNIFGIGDAAALPTAKTGAAIRKQVPVVIENIKALKANGGLGTKKYNGYSSCPIVTEYGKMVLAEFDYDNNFIPDPKLKMMFIRDSSQELWRLWMLKKYGLPFMYWNMMLKGKDI